MLRLSLAIACLVAFAAPSQAQVYKCKGAGGQLVYSQAPCPGDGTLLDSRKPPAETRGPLTQRREVERAMRPPAATPAAAPARAAHPATSDCPDDQELRNLRTAASSTTVSKQEHAKRVLEVEAAQRCRANGSSMAQERQQVMDEIRRDHAQRDTIRQEVREQLRRCIVVPGGVLSC